MLVFLPLMAHHDIQHFQLPHSQLHERILQGGIELLQVVVRLHLNTQMMVRIIQR